MIFHAFYNLDNVGDILLARLTDDKTFSYDTYEDVIVLKNQNGETIGYNILHASLYFTDLHTGLVKITPALVEAFNTLLAKYKLAPVEADFEDKFIVGKVLQMEEHPDSDHLHVCQVDLGTCTTQIVCGAFNVAENQLVVVATVGAVMPSGMIIKPSKLRKVDSNGMLCSARELHLPGAPDVRGILVLDENTYTVGQSFF